MVCQCKCIERHMQSKRWCLEDDETRGRSVLSPYPLVIDESDNPTTHMSGQDDTFHPNFTSLYNNIQFTFSLTGKTIAVHLMSHVS